MIHATKCTQTHTHTLTETHTHIKYKSDVMRISPRWCCHLVALSDITKPNNASLNNQSRNRVNRAENMT